MGETDLLPPMPPGAGETEKEDKPKKGFFKKVFGKKKEESTEEKAVDVPTPEPEASDNSVDKSSNEIDEISKLIDETINDIQKLQTTDTQEEKPVEPKVEEKKEEAKPETKKEDIPEPAPIKEEKKVQLPTELTSEPKVEEKKEETKPEVKEPAAIKQEKKVEPILTRAAPKPSPKKVEKAPVKKVVPTKKVTPKPIVKKAPVKVTPKKNVKKTVKSYSLPSFDKTKTAAKPKIKKTSDLSSKIKELEDKLKDNSSVSAKNDFVLNNGQKFNSLEGLSKALSTMNDETFKHHVTDSRNDFANWIKAELKNAELAKKVDSFFMKHDIKKVVDENIPKKPDAKEIAKISAELTKLRTQKAKEDQEKKYSLPPQDFFKIDNKTIKSIKDLELAVNKVGKNEFAAYVTKNKTAFSNWLKFLTKDFQKQAKDIDVKYSSLVKKVLSEVNDTVDSKVKDAKNKLTKSSKELKAVKLEVEKLKKQKTAFLTEQKTLATKKKQLMAEVSKVKAEHEQVHKLKEKTKLEKEQLHKDITLAKASLEKEKKEHARVIKEAKTTAKKELAELSKQAGSLKTKIQAEEAKIKKEYDKLHDKQAEIDKRDQESKKREDAVTKREDAFESEKLRIENLVKHFEEREKQIELQKSELEVAGFQKYLDSKLKEIHTEDVHDMTFDREVEKARDMIKAGDVDNGKRMYLDLKSKFENANLSASEKDRIYNLLRELYDDIMLALSQ